MLRQTQRGRGGGRGGEREQRIAEDDANVGKELNIQISKAYRPPNNCDKK